MIISLGIDLVEIEEIKISIQKSKHFLERVFTEQEILYCEGKSNRFESYAARFAAKEAVMKALGTGWDEGVQWKQIEVFHRGERNVFEVPKIVKDKPFTEECSEHHNRYSEVDDLKLSLSNCQKPNAKCLSSKPEIRLTGKALEIAVEMGVKNIFLSLSHSMYNAIASVIFEGVMSELALVRTTKDNKNNK